VPVLGLVDAGDRVADGLPIDRCHSQSVPNRVEDTLRHGTFGKHCHIHVADLWQRLTGGLCSNDRVSVPRAKARVAEGHHPAQHGRLPAARDPRDHQRTRLALRSGDQGAHQPVPPGE